MAPFLVALVLSALLVRTRFLALAQVAGFVVLAYLAIGLSFESFTSTKKLALVGFGTGFLAIALEREGGFSRRSVAALVVVLATATTWVAWRLLAQLDIGPALLRGAVAILYVTVLAASTLHVSRDPVAGAATGLMVGLGTGALAVLGASALLGQVGISVGAAAGATLLAQMVRGRNAPVGWTLSLPASVVSALAGVLAVLSAALPWYALLPALAAPWATRLVPAKIQKTWLRAFLCSLAALLPMLAAIALAWAVPAAS
ncbi:MAG: hypothetical protein ABIR26_08710 [Ramlibacter sp.]